MMDKKCLVLVPGLLCDPRLWSAQVEGLSDVAEVTIADMTRDETMSDMAARVLEAVDGPFSLAGLSMGGYVAFEVMRQAPERIERLALLNTGGRADTEDQLTRRRDLIALADRGDFNAVSPRLLPSLIHEGRMVDRALVAEITAMADSVGKEGFLRQQKAIIKRPDSRPNLADIDCPTLVVCGWQDALTPPELSEEIAGLIPNAELVLIDDCGHLSAMECPDETNAALRRWLTA